MSHVRKWGLGIALFAGAAVAGAAALNFNGGRGGGSQEAGWGERSRALAAAAFGSRNEAGSGVEVRTPATAAGKAQDAAGTYILVFEEAALGTYRGGVPGLAAPQRRADARGRLRLDVKGVQARNYVDYLQRRQFEHEGDIARALGRQPDVRMRMQHAINGIVADLTRAEAERVGKLPGVMLVEAYREYVMDTDTGPALIGVEPVWSGTGLPAAYQGEGIVFGIIDSGINFGAPSFAEVDPVDGYVHINPNGANTYLGTCLTGQVDEGRCNDKLIGGYDFVCGPPANQCGVADIREEPGFGDTNGHGSHVASTAGGNRRDVVFRGNPRRISGVAPRANIVAFDVCYTRISTGQGLCPNVSAVASVDQAIADGDVDVFNYSIGGGSQPWTETVSLAFLNASNAGIYVAASAGNSGPGPNTLGHNEPWVSSTAAAQHGRGNFSTIMEVTGPGTVPEPLTAILVNEGTGGVAHTATIPGTTPLRVSAGIDTATDGCNPNPYAAGTFTGAIALIRRGTCPFSEKVINATTAGAIAVVIANNAAGGIIPSVPGTTIPVFGALQSDSNAIRDFVTANPTATASIGFPAVALPNTADALAAFSSRGPAGTFNLVKPDITGPGALVLAAVSGTTLTGFEQAINLLSGTSMSSPHQAGAAGLVRQARPTWTVPEVKSALMMTATQEVFLEDQVTLANPFARGAGRIRVDQAINAGLVMNETGANYLAANPGTGGNESTLNQPSMANRNCVTSCTFTRTFRNTRSSAQIWSTRLQGLTGSVSPKLIKVAAGASVTVQVTIDSSAITANGAFSFGDLVLESRTLRSQPTQPTLRLPIAIAVQPVP